MTPINDTQRLEFIASGGCVWQHQVFIGGNYCTIWYCSYDGLVIWKGNTIREVLDNAIEARNKVLN